MNDKTTSFAELYRRAERRFPGSCPIEAGLLLNLADHECRHGRLPGDPTEPCGCFSDEASNAALRLIQDPVVSTGRMPTHHEHDIAA
jgi:hypothetical protein